MEEAAVTAIATHLNCSNCYWLLLPANCSTIQQTKILFATRRIRVNLTQQRLDRRTSQSLTSLLS